MKPEHQTLHQKFQQFGANAKEWMRKCILLLPEIEKHRIWEQKKFGSIYEYAAKLAGMSRDTVDDALRILKKIEDKPELQKVVEQKGINAVRPIIAIVTKETESFWAEKALQMSRHTLEVYKHEFCSLPRTGPENTIKNRQKEAVEVASTEIAPPEVLVSDSLFACTSAPKTSLSKKIVGMELEPEILEQLEKLKGEGDWNDLMKQLLQLREEQLEAKKPESVKSESRHIPVKIQRYVLTRTNGICSFPGCKKPSKIFHHTQRFALEKVHDPTRLEPLCKAHERIAHHGLIANENLQPHAWQVREYANADEPKFQIDALVMKYRRHNRSRTFY